MDKDLVVIVINKGLAAEVYNTTSNQKVIIVDLDIKGVGEDPITEFAWPETQFDEDRLKELIGAKYE